MKSLVISAAAAVIASACSTPSQMSADAEVNRLCAIDGGIKVYETVKLPVSRFDSFGVVTVPLINNARAADDFYYTWENIELRGQESGTRISRSHYKLLAAKEGKLLGEAIAYSRIGGDVPGPWHPSSHGCPYNIDISNLKRKVFARIDEEKK